MKVLNNVVFEVEKNEKRFSFYMPIGAFYGEAYDAAMECAAEVMKMADEARKKAEGQFKPAESEVVVDQAAS